MSFAETLTQARNNLGITQAELARRIGVSRASISRYESGERTNISFPVIYAICKALGIEVANSNLPNTYTEGEFVMENRDNPYSSIRRDGYVSVSVEEYQRLVYESARNDIVRHLLLAEKTDYIDITSIRIAMGISPISKAQPFANNLAEEKANE